MNRVAVRADFMLQTLQAATDTDSVPTLVNQISRRLGEFGLIRHHGGGRRVRTAGGAI
jgi:hypothetical protein